MYLWDSNILRHYMAGHENLQAHLQRVPWQEIALPSPVVAEVLRGRCDSRIAEEAQQPQAVSGYDDRGDGARRRAHSRDAQ